MPRLELPTAAVLCCADQVDADVTLRNDVPEGLEVWADSGRIVQVGRVQRSLRILVLASF